MSKTRASIGVIAATAVTVMTLFLLPFAPKQAVHTVVITRGDLISTTLLEGAVAYENEQPVVSLQAGMISAIHVAQGQEVKAGQLLFSLDTTLEQQTLAALTTRRYQAEKVLTHMGEEAAAAFSGTALSMDEQEAALRQAIELKQLRAQRDGVVGAVYHQTGEYVAQGALMGLLHSTERCVVAAWQGGLYAQAQTGAAAAVSAADGEAVYAKLDQMGAPTLDAVTSQYVQSLTFQPARSDDLSGFDIGERVMVEMLNQISSNVALAPVEAVDQNSCVWLMRNGVAVSVKVDAAQRNEQYVCVPDALLGERVILLPQESGLTEGCAVKEAKGR